MSKGYAYSKTPVNIRNNWRTPAYIFNYLDQLFHFTTDVAASSDNHLCDRYFTEADNALVKEWGEVNYCNPPYDDIKPWVVKAIEQMNQGKITVMLIPADTSVGWFKLAFDHCSSAVFLTGRIAFINADTGKAVSGNNKGSVVFVFNPHSNKPRSVNLIDRDSLHDI